MLCCAARHWERERHEGGARWEARPRSSLRHADSPLPAASVLQSAECQGAKTVAGRRNKAGGGREGNKRQEYELEVENRHLVDTALRACERVKRRPHGSLRDPGISAAMYGDEKKKAAHRSRQPINK